jgi:hypothetical protein
LKPWLEGSRGTLLPTVLSNGELRREILRIFDRTFTLTYVLEAIAVIIAMLGIINTLVTSVVERRRELATLQALGSSQGQITALILWEAGYLGLSGNGDGTRWGDRAGVDPDPGHQPSVVRLDDPGVMAPGVDGGGGRPRSRRLSARRALAGPLGRQATVG